MLLFRYFEGHLLRRKRYLLLLHGNLYFKYIICIVVELGFNVPTVSNNHTLTLVPNEGILCTMCTKSNGFYRYLEHRIKTNLEKLFSQIAPNGHRTWDHRIQCPQFCTVVCNGLPLGHRSRLNFHLERATCNDS